MIIGLDIHGIIILVCKLATFLLMQWNPKLENCSDISIHVELVQMLTLALHYGLFVK